MQVLEINESERDYWDGEVGKFEVVHPLNAFGWGQVRSIDGWIPSYFVAKRDEVITGAIMVLTRPISGTGFSIMYSQKGPILNLNDQETLEVLLGRVREEAKKRRAIFLRIDPNIHENGFAADNDPFSKLGFIHLEHRWSFWNSPRDVYRIDISGAKSEDELSSMIDRDARRCVRKAAKEGAVIRPAQSRDELKRFYEIFKEFSVGKGFMSRGYAYQESLWQQFVERGKGRLFLAVYQGEIIGGLICILFARKCLAMHMGTPYQYQKLQPNYAYIWESIKWAWENDCIWYSFRGVGTTPSQEYFKKKFGPRVVSLVGYYDLPFYPSLYRLFYRAEFDLLPRLWKGLMKGRRIYNQVRGRLKKDIPE
jgi:lipid II:glycine glycyltransferase (peptidoglycan interpeptide bridge formation enzyme)